MPPDIETAAGAAPGTINDAQVASIRNTGLEDSSNIEFRILSNQPFDVSDELLTLEVGQQRFVNGFYPRGDTNMVAFTLTRAEFDQAINGDLITVRYGNSSGMQWNAGALDKSILNQ